MKYGTSWTWMAVYHTGALALNIFLEGPFSGLILFILVDVFFEYSCAIDKYYLRSEEIGVQCWFERKVVTSASTRGPWKFQRLWEYVWKRNTNSAVEVQSQSTLLAVDRHITPLHYLVGECFLNHT